MATAIPKPVASAKLAPYPDDQSPSGKIAWIPRCGRVPGGYSGVQERKTIESLIDGGTKVEGKLQIGSRTRVEYRSP